MGKKKKKNKKCCCSGSLPQVRIIPVRDIPDNCQLVCVGPYCSLVCYGAGAQTIHCDIICDESGYCTVNCTPDADS